jgi:hypothetical protein
MGIESLFPDFVKVPIMVLVAALLLAPWAARRYPHVEWLQKLKLPDKRMEAQKRKARQTDNFLTGVQLIGFGLLFPPGYAVTEMLIVGAASVLCIGLGIFVIVRARTL